MVLAVPYDLIQTINHPANYFIALQQTLSPTVRNEVKVFVNRAPFINPQASPLPYAVHTNNWARSTTITPITKWARPMA